MTYDICAERQPFRLPSLDRPLEQPLIVVDTEKIEPYFRDYRTARQMHAATQGVEVLAKVKAQVTDIFHAKAGPLGIVSCIPYEIPVVTSFKHFPRVIQTRADQGGKVIYHLAQPDSADLAFDFLQAPPRNQIRRQAIETRKMLGSGGRNRLAHMVDAFILDGSTPPDTSMEEYVGECKNVHPKADFVFKVQTGLITQNFDRLLYTAKNGLKIDDISQLMYQLRWGGRRFGINLYIGNPLDNERINSITEFMSRLDENLVGNAGDRLPKLSCVYVGGIGGYGDETSHEKLIDLYREIWTRFPKMKIVVEHGRAAVEQTTYALFPHAPLNEIAAQLPDYSTNPGNLKTENVTIVGKPVVLVHGVAYLDTQRPDIPVQLIP